MTLGTVVVSKAGRDKGKLLMVLSVEEPYVVLADGGSRKIEKPKRKKLRHVTPSGYQELLTRDQRSERLKTGVGKELTNRELRGILSRIAASEQEG